MKAAETSIHPSSAGEEGERGVGGSNLPKAPEETSALEDGIIPLIY
jgi:hypothetical protein